MPVYSKLNGDTVKAGTGEKNQVYMGFRGGMVLRYPLCVTLNNRSEQIAHIRDNRDESNTDWRWVTDVRDGPGIREINDGWDRDSFRLAHTTGFNRPNQCVRDRHDHTQIGAN